MGEWKAGSGIPDEERDGASPGWRVALLAVTVLVVGVLHMVTPSSFIFWHTLYRRVIYLPIVIGGIWFGLRGGLAFSLMATVAFIPHLWRFSGQSAAVFLNEALEIPLYIGAGFLVGWIADREARLRRRYQEISRKLEKSYERLHRESAMLIELEEQLAQSRKMSALGELSASIAHEIKNPLASIRGTVEIIADEFGPDHPKRRFADILLKETGRLAAAVSNVLSYARRGRAGGGGERLEPLSAVVERTVALAAGEAKRKRARIESFVSSETSAMPVPADRLGQVLLNLLLNACEAVAEGGYIRVKSWLEQGGLRLEVADDGPGIPEEIRKDMFRPFKSGKPGGTGLGLAISARMVSACGGELVAGESDLGGAALRIVMPEAGCAGTAGRESGKEAGPA